MNSLKELFSLPSTKGYRGYDINTLFQKLQDHKELYYPSLVYRFISLKTVWMICNGRICCYYISMVYKFKCKSMYILNKSIEVGPQFKRSPLRPQFYSYRQLYVTQIDCKEIIIIKPNKSLLHIDFHI